MEVTRSVLEIATLALEFEKYQQSLEKEGLLQQESLKLHSTRKYLPGEAAAAASPAFRERVENPND